MHGESILERLSDQPGRVLAVFVFAPILMIKGVHYKDWFLIAFALLLFVWDLYWLVFKAPCKSDTKNIVWHPKST